MSGWVGEWVDGWVSRWVGEWVGGCVGWLVGELVIVHRVRQWFMWLRGVFACCAAVGCVVLFLGWLPAWLLAALLSASGLIRTCCSVTAWADTLFAYMHWLTAHSKRFLSLGCCRCRALHPEQGDRPVRGSER